MSEQMEMTLRKSLDEVDRIRRRQIAGLAIFVLFFLAQAGSVIFTLHNAGANTEPSGVMGLRTALRVMLIENVELMVFTVGFCTFGICFFMTRMTSKILKAIELSSKG